MGRALPWESKLLVLSRTCQVWPPSIERKRPTPPVVVLPSPVAAKMIDCLGSLLRPNTAMLPMFKLVVGPKAVRSCQVGPFGLVVRKSVVFQTPPLAPAAYTVLPEGSDGSTARLLTRPEFWPLLLPGAGFSEAGPTCTHSLVVRLLVGSCTKMRKPTVTWSATGSPRPLPGTICGKVMDHEVRSEER